MPNRTACNISFGLSLGHGQTKRKIGAKEHPGSKPRPCLCRASAWCIETHCGNEKPKKIVPHSQNRRDPWNIRMVNDLDISLEFIEERGRNPCQ